MSGGWIVMRQDSNSTISRSPLRHDDRGKPDAGFELRMQRLRDTGGTGRRVVRRRVAGLGRRYRGARNRYGREAARAGGIAVPQLHQRREEHDDLRKNRHARQRATDRSGQLAPHANTHSR